MLYVGMVLVGLLLGAPAGAAGQSYVGKLQAVIDGDTIHLLRETGQIVRLELYGIDAPELGQTHGPAAARAVRRLLFDKRIRAVGSGTDDDGRPLFVVTVDDRAVNEELVRLGHAWWDRRRAPRDDRLRRLEAEARANGRGLWARTDPVPPWVWRGGEEGR
jgi:endonuclease YncB( thermonuclease family)